MEINKNLRVSTMTVISGIDSNIDLKSLYENLDPTENIKYIEYFKQNKGESIKKIKNPRTHKEKKYFYNQLTMQIDFNKIVNMKVFNNGKIQMTGLKSHIQSINIVQIFINRLMNISEDKMCSIRGKDIGFIFQEPMTALNPLKNIGDQVSEVIKLHLNI